ncbi:uncharacterized protein [Dendrobates tinctorius]|uniref:uncharacterized protein n=1 Tax=Dendrobates tinctorius TaxID=92724 RepID=UPI003CC9CAF0
MGHKGALKLEPRNVDAIASWPSPRTTKQMMFFLGTAGCYRFVPHYSSLVKHLTDLIKKKLPFAVDWTNDCETAFRVMKATFSSIPILQAADFTRSFAVQTDASGFGLFAVLSQVDYMGQRVSV